MSEQGVTKRVIPKNAPLALAIREYTYHYQRTEKRSIAYSWFCRGCLKTNRVEVFQTEPLLQITCAHCKLTVQRSCFEDDWHCWLPG